MQQLPAQDPGAAEPVSQHRLLDHELEPVPRLGQHALPVHAFGDRRRDVVAADSLPVPGRLQDDRGVLSSLQQARQDLRLVAADQRRLFEGRADGLLCQAEPGAVRRW